MASIDVLELNIDAGEDFAAQVVWSDNDGVPFVILSPCQADVVDSNGSVVMSFRSTYTNPITQALISISSSQDGFLQLTAPKALTKDLLPGTYAIDLFATTTSADEFWVTTSSSASGASTLTFLGTDTTAIKVGWLVSGTGVASDTVISSINSTTDVVTLSKPLTATVASGATITFTRLQEIKVFSGWVVVHPRKTIMGS